jgi:hypothetical protein
MQLLRDVYAMFMCCPVLWMRDAGTKDDTEGRRASALQILCRLLLHFRNSPRTSGH